MAMRIPASMGFLSRKTKNKPVTVDEPHPIFEELERMEEAVPERPERLAPRETSKSRTGASGRGRGSG